MREKSEIPLTYILGSGRSGSTILDATLGNHPSVVSVGELGNAVVSGWGSNQPCACGESVDDCEWWAAVKEKWFAGLEGPTLEEYYQLQTKFERIRSIPKHFGARDEAFVRYESYTVGLFEAIRDVSGASVVVDSSKGLGRAVALASTRGLDVRIIHLVRDPRGVCNSMAKALKKNLGAGVQDDLSAVPVWRTAFEWFVYNLLCLLAVAKGSRGLTLRYEEFVASPVEVLRRLERELGESMEALVQKFRNDSSISFCHQMAGNRVRMTGNVLLKMDRSWAHQLSLRQRILIILLTSPLFFFLGYRWGPGHGIEDSA